MSQFARLTHPEKTLEELQQLLQDIENSPPRPAQPARVRSVNTERLLGEERVDELLARYADGASANAIASEFGISAASVMRLVRKRGLDAHDRLPSDAVIRRAAELYADGLSLQGVSDEVRVPKSTLRRALIDAGIALRRPRRI